MLRRSEGYNPHPVMSLALPLSVGQESDCELLDFETNESFAAAEIPSIILRLNKSLPEGINALEIYISQRKFSLIKWISVVGGLEYDDLPDITSLAEPFRRDTLPIIKKTKRGGTLLDLCLHTRNVKFSTNGADIAITALVSAQEPTINPDMMLEVLPARPASIRWRRIALYDKDLTDFR